MNSSNPVDNMFVSNSLSLRQQIGTIQNKNLVVKLYYSIEELQIYTHLTEMRMFKTYLKLI